MYAPRSIANVTHLGATLPKRSCAVLKKSAYAIATIATISTFTTPALAELGPTPSFPSTFTAQGLEEPLDPLSPPLIEPFSEPPIAPAESAPAEDDFFSLENSTSGPTDEEIESEVGDIQPLPRPRQAQTPPQPNGQLLLRSSAFTSSNVTGSALTSTGDAVFSNQATFIVTPKLGPDTRLIATAGGGLTRFANEGENNYNSLGISIGVQQRFSDTTYGQLGWVNDQLYSIATGENALSDNSARLVLGRQDELADNLRLDTAYELRARFTSPVERSRISNSVSTRLRYDFSADWQAALSYRLSFSEYTQNSRSDTSHQIQAATTYAPTKDTFVTGFASYAFGNSSATSAELDNLSFGIGIGVNLPLF
ncbi:MAG: hypothetical protein AAGL08_05750 [Cyanobacteria bacterium J06573_11]